VWIVPTFHEVEDAETGLRSGRKRGALGEFAFEDSKKFSRIALLLQSPADPIDGRTPASLQHWPKASAAY
jgi:hypothetical protein